MNIGLVLSGGGARGAAHVGVLKAFEEYGVSPTHIAGTSIGAVVGAMYAKGIHWSEILFFLKDTSIFSATRYAFNKPGFIDTEKFYDDLKKIFPEDNFKALDKPLFVTATNVITGKLKIFSKGELIMPIIASASLPGVFTPTEVEGEYYIDGGVLNNFPVEPLQEPCDKIIGVFINELNKISIEDLKHSYTVVDRAIKIKTNAEAIRKFTTCDLIISPKGLGAYSIFGMNHMDTVFELGYVAAVNSIKTKASVLGIEGKR